MYKSTDFGGGALKLPALPLSFASLFNGFLLLTLLAVFIAPSSLNAVISLTVPNGDFEATNNFDSEEAPFAGLLGNYDREFGTGPWSAAGTGILNLLAAPETTIGSGVAVVSSLASVNIGGILSNSATFYQNDIGSTFLENYAYTLTVSFVTSELLTVSAFENSKTGVSLRSDGVATPLSGAGILLDLAIVDTNSGTLTYTFTADASFAGKDIGVELYVGKGSALAAVDALGDVTFNNVELTATAVPEPAMFALIGGLLAISCVSLRRVRRSK